MSRTEYLKGRTAVVTGASGGIGKAISEKLAGFGMQVLLVGRSEAKLEQTAALVRAAGGTPSVCAGNLTCVDFTEQVVATALERFGGLDVLINCAGVAQHDDFEAVTPEKFDQIMAANVRGPYFLCQRSLPALRASGVGTIINICSVVAHKGYPYQSVYAASKHALLGLSKSLANEVYQDNVRVHVISPGGVYTDMVKVARPDLTPDGMTLPEDIADIVEFFLARRLTDAVVDEVQVHRTNKEPFA